MIMSHVLSSGLGAVTLTPEQQKLVGEPLTTLAEQEKRLRAMAQTLANDIGVLARSDRTLNAAFIGMLQKYNAAVAAQTRAASVFLEARQNVPLSALPDPGAKPIAIPTFDLPATSGLGDAGVKAADVAIKFGVLGKEQSRSILDYTQAPNAGLGFVGIAAMEARVLLGLIISAVIATYVYNNFSGNALKTQEFETTQRVAKETTKVTELDYRIYRETLDFCEKSGVDRLTCIEKSQETLGLQKQGRPQFPLKNVLENPLFTFGAIGILGLIGWFAYRGYKRKQLVRGGASRRGPRPAFPTAPMARPVRPMARFAPETLDEES